VIRQPSCGRALVHKKSESLLLAEGAKSLQNNYNYYFKKQIIRDIKLNTAVILLEF
jgi:hypothetical protein